MEFCTGNGIKYTAQSGTEYPAIGLRDIADLMKNPDSVEKNDARWLIPSTYRAADAREHDAQRENGLFGAIVIDLDSGNHSIDEIKTAIIAAIGNVGFMVYATKSATPDAKRWRVIIPRKTSLAWGNHIAQMRAVLALLSQQGIKGDPCAARAGQVAYLPNRGEHYEYLAHSTTLLSDNEAITEMQRQIAIDDARKEESAKRAKVEREKLRASRPMQDGETPTEWFNANHSVAEMLDRYGYQRLGNDYRSPQSTTGSYAVRVFDQSWVSHSGTDYDSGIGMQAVSKDGESEGFCWGDAFDLFAFYEHGNDATKAWRAIREMMGRDKMHQEFEPIRHCETGEDAGFEQIDAIAVDVTPKDEEPQPKAPVPTFENAPMDIFSNALAPRFDLSAMPQPIQDFVTVNRPAMGAPESLMAMAALGACMAAVDKRISIKPQQSTGWREHPVLWLMGVGDPSVKKSPVRNLAFREITQIEKNSAAEARAKQRRYDLELKAFKKQEAAFIRELNKGDAIIDDAPEPPIKPEGMRFTVETTTIEALMHTAANNPAGLVLNSDELSGWFGAMDAYSGGSNGGASKDRPLWLQAYNSQATTIDRVGGGQLSVDNFAVGACGFVQPDALRGALKNLPVDGLLQRFMPFIGVDAELSKDVPADAMGNFNILVANIRLIQDANTIEVEPSKGARDIINALWSEKLFPLLQYDGIPSPTRNHIAKLEGALWRITLLFHIIETTDNGMPPSIHVSEATAQRACDLVEGYLAPSILHLHEGILGKTGANDIAAAVARWIIAHDIKDFRIRDVVRNVRAFSKLEADFEKLTVMRQLEDAGWVASNPLEMRLLPREWMAHPNASKAFADVAETDRKRRANVVQMFNELRKGK